MATTNGNGPELLKRYLTTNGLRAVDLSRDGFDPAALSRWLRGQRRPGLEHAHELEQYTAGAVPASSWIPKRKRSRSA